MLLEQMINEIWDDLLKIPSTISGESKLAEIHFQKSGMSVSIVKNLFQILLIYRCVKSIQTQFFLVRIFLNSDQKKLRIWILCTQCIQNTNHTVKESGCMLLSNIYPEVSTRGVL